MMCQCPSTGYFIFYWDADSIIIWNELCQCPSTGYFIFYERKTGQIVTVCRCQCPSTGYFIFYPLIKKKYGDRIEVSMPFNGLLHFLLHYVHLMYIHNHVSMPFNGLLHFLQGLEEKIRSHSWWVSMPFNGLLHFLLWLYIINKKCI